MTNISIRMWSAWLVAAAILLSSAGIMAFDGDSQLFGKKEDEKNVPLKKAEKKPSHWFRPHLEQKDNYSPFDEEIAWDKAGRHQKPSKN